ncbi:DHA2 family efflux MFS transporter permease subunit [Nakamurella lactea]|uniref:DHA2 family efflux MFS transporter permease subunit n=1 Tax=Nakamurella lactea TaxID=459515 RepID=UPI000406DE6E|nr:DHA2 family efflux MFS transporter permease subunit [Nakamurella lactea]
MSDERRQKIAVATVFVAAMFINIIDATVVNVALPTIALDFGVPVDQTATINIGFLVAVAVAIPVAGWLGDRFGPRGVFIGALAAFTVASGACGLAGSVEQLVLFRVLQGLGGGLMTPVGLAMLFRTFPANERVRLSRITTVPIAFAPALGPVLGGFLVEHVNWRWIFGINIPIGALALIFTLIWVRPLAPAPRTRLDIAGFLLAGIGFAALMFAVSEGPSRGWGSPLILVCGLVGLGLLVLLVMVELRLTAPMLHLRLYALRLFRSANLVTMASSAGFLGALFAYPLMLQTSFGYGAMEAGLLTFPEAFGIMIGTQLVGRRYGRVGPRRLIAGGQTLVCLLLLTMAAISGQRVPPVVLVLVMLVLGIGQSHTFVPTQAAAFDTVPRDKIGAGTSLYNATRQAGSAIGVAIAATVIAAIGVGLAPDADPTPFRWALVACAACNALGVFFALTIDDNDAAPSRGHTTSK